MISSSQAVHWWAANGQGTLGGTDMTGEDVRQVFEASLPHEAIEDLCVQFGVIERQRKLDLGTSYGHRGRYPGWSLPG
jgi:hypothetical protein